MKARELRQAEKNGTRVIGVEFTGGRGGGGLFREVEHEGVPVRSKQVNSWGHRMWMVDGWLFNAYQLDRVPSA